MKHRYIVTIDVGTSSTKTALWDESGYIVAETSLAYSLHRPHPLWAEIDANIWWNAVCSTTRKVIASNGIDPHHVAGIGVDGIGWTLVPVDRHVNPLHAAMIWLDRRAEAESEWLRALPDAEKLVQLAANPLDAAYVTPKLLWLKSQYPSVFDRAYKFMGASGFITAQLTGEFTCDYTQAYGFHFFDLRKNRWDDWAAGLLGIPLDKMPRLCPCTEIVGSLTTAAAAQMGLVADIPVIAGCLDAAAGALGSGVTQPGQTNEQGGQAGGFAISLNQVVVEPRLIFSHHALPGQYLLQAGTVGGGSLGWFRDVLGQTETNACELLGLSPFELFSMQVERTRPGAHGLLFFPYMAGERTPLWNSNVRGIIFGLTYNTSRADLLRAIMEGCVLAVYDNLHFAEAKGAVVTEYLGSGGATHSAAWCQIKADIYGKPFIVARRDDGSEGGHSLGLYALTAQAMGLCADAGDCVHRLLSRHQVFEPRPEYHAIYEDMFQVYRNVSRKVLVDFDQLASITRKHSRIGAD